MRTYGYFSTSHHLMDDPFRPVGRGVAPSRFERDQQNSEDEPVSTRGMLAAVAAYGVILVVLIVAALMTGGSATSSDQVSASAYAGH
jgi:hypothetical protein